MESSQTMEEPEIFREGFRRRAVTKSALRILRGVSIPESLLFFTDFGQYANVFASSLPDFVDKLEMVPLKSIEFHFQRGDFARWTSDTSGDKSLAERIDSIGQSSRGEALRGIIQTEMEKRINQLRRLMERTLLGFWR